MARPSSVRSGLTYFTLVALHLASSMAHTWRTHTRSLRSGPGAQPHYKPDDLMKKSCSKIDLVLFSVVGSLSLDPFLLRNNKVSFFSTI